MLVSEPSWPVFIQQHVERFGAANFADDDASRPHPQRVADQVPNANFACTFDVLAAHLERDAVGQLTIQEQLGYFLHGDDAFVQVGDFVGVGIRHAARRGARRAAGFSAS